MGKRIPPIEVQLDRLRIFDPNVPDGGMFVDPNGPVALHVDQPTYLVAHNWDQDSGEPNTRAAAQVGCALHRANPEANVLAWDWAGVANPDGDPETYRKLWLPGHRKWAYHKFLSDPAYRDWIEAGWAAVNEGNILGRSLAALLEQHGSLGTSLHLVGHGHGGALLGQTASVMKALRQRADTLTTLDTPRWNCQPEGCVLDLARYIDPGAVRRAAVLYYDFDWPPDGCVGLGVPVAGASNVALNCRHVPDGDLPHFWLAGDWAMDQQCPATYGWYPPGVFDPNSNTNGVVRFNGDQHVLTNPITFPVGTYREDQLYEFHTVYEPLSMPGGDPLDSLEVCWQEAFDNTVSEWTATNAVRTRGADPADPLNYTVVLTEQGDACLFRTLDWPLYGLALTFDYFFREPNGGGEPRGEPRNGEPEGAPTRGNESLTVYIGDQVVYYDHAQTTQALGQLRRSEPIYVGHLGTTQAELNFVLRTDGQPGASVVLDNLTVHALPRGDTDCDGRLTFHDINPFLAALAGQAKYEAAYPDCVWSNADCDADGLVTINDVEPFVALLTRG